jgi:glycolate oxidase
VQVIYFGHAGDGNIHVSAIRNFMESNEWKRRTYNLLNELYKKSNEFNGLPSGEHGIGLTKKEYFEKVTEDINLEYMKGIKNIFDKNNILNTGKVYC